MAYFNPAELLQDYVACYDYCRADPLQVYPAAKAPRIPMVKILGPVQAFDHGEALRKARSLYPIPVDAERMFGA